MMRLLVLVLLFFGASVSAQSVDQRKLSECIAESQETIALAQAWKESIEAIGQKPWPFVFADQNLVGYKDTLLRDTFKMLEVNKDNEKVMAALEESYNRIQFRIDLISNMVQESFDTPNEYRKLAEFITQCANNYGGEFYTLQNEIDDLKLELSKSNRKYEETIKKHETEIRNLKVRHKADARSQLDPYIKRIETLCNWMKIQKQDDIMKKQVFVYGKKYDLCD